MAKHHIVQDKYLAQWKIDETVNHLNVFIIPENKCDIANTKSPLFWRKDFNILDDDGKKSYLPEDVTGVIDTKGIDAIRSIDVANRSQLVGPNRCHLAFYIALQYIRTPRYRDESNKMIDAQAKYRMRMDISSPDKVLTTKQDLLDHEPENEQEKEAMEKIKEMSEEEIQKQIFESIHGEYGKIGLTRGGHSKSILKVDRHAKGLFEVQWTFLIAPQNTSFITSDSPCFAISNSKIMNGLLSPRSRVIFPLRPDVCVYIRPALKSKTELFMDLDEKDVRDINKYILENSYDCLVAKDKPQLEDLTKDFDFTKHRKSRDVAISENGPYVMFNLE